MQDSSKKNEAAPQKKATRLNRPISVSYKVLFLLLILLIAIPLTVFLTLDRLGTHSRWYWQERASQTFLFHVENAASILNHTGSTQLSDNQSFENSETLRNWFFGEIFYADLALSDLNVLDNGHHEQLQNISDMIQTLDSHGLYLTGLNATQRSSLASSIRNVGERVAAAYWNYLKNTSSSTGSGPPFWYFGPSPPDETVLQQAADLAAQINLQVGG